MTDTFRCGHPRSPENSKPRGNGSTKVRCRICAKASCQRYKVKRAQIKAPEPAPRFSPGKVRAIQKAVSARFGVRLDDMLSDRRGRDVAVPRQVAMMLARDLTPHSLPLIARFFYRDHTTLIHGIRAAQARIAQNAEMRRAVRDLRRELSA